VLYPTDAFELVIAHPYLAGTSPNANNLPGLPKVRCFYDIPESDWTKVTPPFIVWVPGRDSFDTGQRQQVELVRKGREEAIEAIGRCVHGHDLHLFVARTSDLQCHREMFLLLTRVLVAMRYALNTTANYHMNGGQMDPNRERYPSFLHYTLSVSEYIPIVDVPDMLAEVLAVQIMSSVPVDPTE
jgi:hypothetical protein